jgi:RNA polymerase sigma-70 factor (ECF subfamily)
MAADDEIEACVRSQYARLVGVVSLVAGSRATAEEAVQEAFARALEIRRRGAVIDNLPAWVVTVALNRARSGRRRDDAERRAVGRLAARATVGAEPDREVEPVVRDALEGLARRQREAVVLYYFLDLDVATVARILGVAEGTVKTALSRARSRLAVLLADEEVQDR